MQTRSVGIGLLAIAVATLISWSVNRWRLSTFASEADKGVPPTLQEPVIDCYVAYLREKARHHAIDLVEFDVNKWQFKVERDSGRRAEPPARGAQAAIVAHTLHVRQRLLFLFPVPGTVEVRDPVWLPDGRLLTSCEGARLLWQRADATAGFEFPAGGGSAAQGPHALKIPPSALGGPTLVVLRDLSEREASTPQGKPLLSLAIETDPAAPFAVPATLTVETRDLRPGRLMAPKPELPPVDPLTEQGVALLGSLLPSPGATSFAHLKDAACLGCGGEGVNLRFEFVDAMGKKGSWTAPLRVSAEPIVKDVGTPPDGLVPGVVALTRVGYLFSFTAGVPSAGIELSHKLSISAQLPNAARHIQVGLRADDQRTQIVWALRGPGTCRVLYETVKSRTNR